MQSSDVMKDEICGESTTSTTTYSRMFRCDNVTVICNSAILSLQGMKLTLFAWEYSQIATHVSTVSSVPKADLYPLPVVVISLAQQDL